MKARDLLLPHLFPDFKLIGGANGLGNEIKKVAVFDTPDMSYWVQGGEFLMGNGFIFKDDIASLPLFLRRVKEKDIAAIGIKFDRFGAFLDMSEIAGQADALKLPVFRIPFRYRWLDVIEKSMFEIRRTSDDMMDLHADRSFLAEMDSLGTLLQEMASRIDKPIFFSSRGEEGGTVFWPGGKGTFKSGAASDDYCNAQIRETRQLLTVLNFLGIREESRAFADAPLSKIYFTESPPFFELHILFEKEGEKLSGMEEKIVRRSISAVKTLMLEQSVLQSLQQNEIAQTLERLLHGSYSTPGALLQTLRKWDLVNPLPCRIAVIPRKDASTELIGYSDMPYRFTCSLGKVHALLIPWEMDADSEKNAGALRYLEKYGEPVALGTIAGTLEEIPRSFQDAQRVLAYMQRNSSLGKTVLYENLVLELTLGHLSETDDATRLWSAYWKPLKEHKGSSIIKLSDFTSTLIDCNFNLVDCAERLNVHYNTARKYADAIEKVIGASLKDFKTQACLLIGRNSDDISR